MKQYVYQEHTAEAKFTAFGSSLEEAFINAALATSNIIIKTEEIKPVTKKQITVEAKHLKGLLYDFLQEFIVLFDSEFYAINKIEDLKIKQKDNAYSLTCTCYGDDTHKYETLSGVKAVTYNEMEIVEEKNKWHISVVLDV
jgi:SHS2 domain-containing protein